MEDAAVGYFEWTPDQNLIDNATADSRSFTFTFQITDGAAASTQTKFECLLSGLRY